MQKGNAPRYHKHTFTHLFTPRSNSAQAIHNKLPQFWKVGGDLEIVEEIHMHILYGECVKQKPGLRIQAQKYEIDGKAFTECQLTV